ncbi:hypothetical protein [Sphingomonas jatrophae]|uniref:Chain length determinant protein n=1 Tax=Sphingomonas jatrophae TaxID=1166337 RepID=A0A1I6JRX0_9SPHN|nr:hypothetical protein [Sphingomonas jatrophae]SFR81716.1 hypothetical protein SAMN05192580_0749 [Sphingomonas jatrophae]
MTPPRSIIGNLTVSSWFANPWRRRAILFVLAVIFAVLALFPRLYRTASSLTPTDPSSLGLQGALGQLGAGASVFGSQAAVEISLKVARSQGVRRAVAADLDLPKRLNMSDPLAIDRWLVSNVEIRSLRGGIIQVESKLTDAKLGLDLVRSFTQATRFQLARIARNQTAYKRDVLVNLVRSSRQRLDRAQAAYDSFRRRTRYSQPGPSIGAIGARIPTLQAELKAREVELNAARAFATDENMSVRRIIAEIQAIRRQLAEAQSLDANDPDSVNRVVVQSTQVQDLERELNIARGLYEGYRRYLEGAAVEDLTSTSSVRVLEEPYVDSARQFRTIPAGLFILIVLLAGAMEFYLMRPPLGDPRRNLSPAR